MNAWMNAVLILLAILCALLLLFSIIAIRDANAEHAKVARLEKKRDSLTSQVEQYGKDAIAQSEHVDAALQELAGMQENLKNCLNYWKGIAQPEIETLRGDNVTLKGQVAARDEKIRKLEADLKEAKYHGKKKPTTTEIVSQ